MLNRVELEKLIVQFDTDSVYQALFGSEARTSAWAYMKITIVNQTFTPLFLSDGQREWSGDTCVNFVFSAGMSVEPISFE